jgi:hypothetical protein
MHKCDLDIIILGHDLHKNEVNYTFENINLNPTFKSTLNPNPTPNPNPDNNEWSIWKEEIVICVYETSISSFSVTIYIKMRSVASLKISTLTLILYHFDTLPLLYITDIHEGEIRSNTTHKHKRNVDFIKFATKSWSLIRFHPKKKSKIIFFVHFNFFVMSVRDTIAKSRSTSKKWFLISESWPKPTFGSWYEKFFSTR